MPKHLLLLLAFTFAAEVHAERPEVRIVAEPASDLVVNAESIEIMGSGIQNRNTHEVIALACAGKFTQNQVNGCHELRMVSFSPQSSQAIFFGPIFKSFINGVQETQDLRPLLKVLTKKMKKARHDANRSVFRGAGYSVPVAVLIVGGWAVMAPPVLFLIVGGATAGLLGFFILPATLRSFPTLLPAHSKSTLTQFNSQRGWDWAVTPKKVNETQFNLFKSALTVSAAEY